MKINLYCIAKKDWEDDFVAHYQRLCRQFGARLEIYNIFHAEILQAQKKNPKDAQMSYAKFLSPYLSGDLDIALHKDSKVYDSLAFSALLESKNINFFIGGAFGFEQNFLKQTKTLSLSALTLSHGVAKIVLCEQIYRGLSILHKHPYHK
ncbi:23S rRNA (pseudouridine(1915)-N(3))-methyltransferase RlmH [Helicobacter mustelae]|uniref:Ribosomal RNA large subunit methyltransferase H n=1 Tax=Helicobacter mustelae (strain ATCC 43772 / CCUG 25715 / CIP 103759 / LMG 18044 / NCTC 12198 / R85-136P) TaxID=679897 RepID=D3UFX6_HELM1|nr:23S rRNA (pseudouridine(1915)-N(3))-methyltransferase RlmH [Helicobacter mustelae]CBG39397.1 hypothetical protein HMU01350 [Helicobacter mustelae 12198]SQH70910.1 rRNA large subunit methyltransferase [Helicobacter mustelae]STP12037.1 rRNA large subunit methyltransferase [Helicobacter mustelae]